MAAINDITGDSIASRGPSKNFTKNYSNVSWSSKTDSTPDWIHLCKKMNVKIQTSGGKPCAYCGIEQ